MGQGGEGTTAMIESEDKRDFVLSALRAGSLRAKLYETEINSIGVALKGGLIDCYTAMEWVKEIGALELVRCIPPPDDGPLIEDKP